MRNRRKGRVRMIVRWRGRVVGEVVIDERQRERAGPKGGVTGIRGEGLRQWKLKRVEKGGGSHIADARGG